MGRKEVFDLKSSKAKEIPDKEDGLNENEGSQFEKKYEKDSQKPSKLEAEEPRSRIERKYEEDSQKPRKRKAKEPKGEDGEDGSASDVKSDDSVSLDGAASEGEDGEDGAASGSRIERKYEEDSQKPRKRKAKEPSGSQFGKKYEKDSEKPSETKAKKQISAFSFLQEGEEEVDGSTSDIQFRNFLKALKWKEGELGSQFGKKYGKNSRKPSEPKADEFGLSFLSANEALSRSSLGDDLINEFKPPVKVVLLPQPKEPVKQGDIPQPKGS